MIRWLDWLLVVGLFLIGLFSFWATASVTQFIQVSQIDIADTPFGGDIHVEVSRIIRRDFEGSYIVTISDANTGLRVCSTGRVDVGYQRLDAGGELMPLPDPISMRWWAFGGDCFQGNIETGQGVGALSGEGLPVGFYTEETCHGVRLMWGLLPPRWTCWDSDTFRIYDM